MSDCVLDSWPSQAWDSPLEVQAENNPPVSGSLLALPILGPTAFAASEA